jgi:hypothetical protein
MKSWTTPTPDIVDKAVASMVRFEQQRHFFEKLENPMWIEPLKKKGWFSESPIPKRDAERGTIEFRAWPSLKYLSRMAAKEPKLVADVMVTIPDSDNPYIVQSFISAASSMPPELAKRLVPQIVKMVKSPHIMQGHTIGDLAVRLAAAAENKSALDLLRAALEVIPDPRPVSEEMKAIDPDYAHEARTRMGSFECQWILQRNGPDLLKLIGAPFISLLCDLLERALSFEQKPSKEEELIEDYSYIWRPSLSSGETTDYPKRFLVAAILQNADAFAAQSAKHLETVRTMLAKRRFKVFRRLELEIVLRHLDLSGDDAAEMLVDKVAFEDIGQRYEYDSLLSKAFQHLEPPQRGQILSWIEGGLKTERLLERGFSKEEAEDASNAWRLERLTPIKDFLEGDWQERYESLHKKFGDPPDRTRPRGGFYQASSKSPKPSPELEEMSVADVIEYLKNWRPMSSGSFPFGPSEEGLGAVLTEIIAKKPAEFSEQLDKLKETDPTYVRSALQGFESAVRGKKAFDWKPVLDLALWVVKQPIEIPGRTGDHWTKDPDWGWARSASISLIEQGFKEKAIPFAVRSQVWTIIAGLAENKEGSKEVPYTDPDSQNKDIWTHSVNRTEARAMRVVFQYIEWCRDNLKEEKFSLASVPEAEKLLSTGLDTEIQSSLDIRLVYGELLPFLVSVDRQWVENNKSKIFPPEPEKRSLRDIAWVAYLTANYAYNLAFEILGDLYLSAVQSELGEPRQVGTGHMVYNPDEGLIHHLMQLYWRGRIGLEENGIVDIFLKQASDEMLARMVRYLGQSLKDTKELSGDERQRLEKLWDRSISWPDDSQHKRELEQYGWWFNSNHFDDQWALEHIHKSLQLSRGEFDPKLGTLERLAKLAEKYPKLVVQSAQLIVSADFENVILWHDDLKKILRTVLKSGDAEAMKIARSIIQNLGAKGYLEYRALLTE